MTHKIKNKKPHKKPKENTIKTKSELVITMLVISTILVSGCLNQVQESPTTQPEKQLAISASSYVMEGESFQVTVITADSIPIDYEIEVLFLNKIYYTNSNGTVLLTAPSVEHTTNFTITAIKTGGQTCTMWITVIDSTHQIVITTPHLVMEGERFQVRVTANNNSVQNAIVTAEWDNYSYYTDKNGTARLTAPLIEHDSNYTIIASKTGYMHDIRVITVRDNSTSFEEQLVIDAPSSVVENESFQVIITAGNISTENVTVSFLNSTYLTNANGTVSLTAPLVEYTTNSSITASKIGYIDDIAWIKVNDNSPFLEPGSSSEPDPSSEPNPQSNPPVLIGEKPTNQSINISASLTTINVTINDPDGDTMSWTIETSPYIGSSYGNNQGNGNKTCTVSGLFCRTTYHWYVNVSDGSSWTNETYHFTTNNTPDPFGYPKSIAYRTTQGREIENLSVISKYDMVIGGGCDKFEFIKENWPDIIIVSHANYETISVDEISSIFPGHLLYYNGANITQDVAENDTRIYVDNVNVFSLDPPDFVTLYRVNGGGPDWSYVEYTDLTGIGEDYIEVERGVYSDKKSFQAGSARAVPNAMEQPVVSIEAYVLQINYGLECPEDENGMKVYEARAKYFADSICPYQDGYEFDVASWWANAATNNENRSIDCNNDLVPDSGIVYYDGVGYVNSYGLGVVEFARHLRNLLGDDKYILGDHKWRAFDYANGVEIEGYPHWRNYDLFSSNFNRLLYWRDYAYNKPGRLLYPFTKESTEAFTNCPVEDEGTNYKFRVGITSSLLINDSYFAYASASGENDSCMLGWGNDFYLDEFNAGLENRSHYLGKPLEGYKRVFNESDNFIPNGDFENGTDGWLVYNESGNEASMFIDDSTSVSGNNSLRVEIGNLSYINGLYPPVSLLKDIRLMYQWFTVETVGEYTLRFWAKAETSYRLVNSSYSSIPREIGVRVRVAGGYESGGSFLVGSDWREYYITFNVSETGNARIEFLLGMESGDFWVDNVDFFGGSADRFYRRYEGGLVLLNAGWTPFTFNLGDVSPGIEYRRINGTQDPEVNNGEDVGDEVILPGMDGIILLKK